MMHANNLARSLHDLGLAGWFGGSLMGAVGLNGGAASAEDPKERSKIADVGWAKWTPVNFAAIAAHLLGGAALVAGNAGRVVAQDGVKQHTYLKTGLTAAALGVTAYARVLGKKLEEAGPIVVEGPTQPAPDTPKDIAAVQRQLKWTQWAIPAATGALLVLGARMGEQQRPQQVLSGIAKHMLPAVGNGFSSHAMPLLHRSN